MAFTEPTETLVNYPLNGSNRRFSIPFDYLQRSFIRISLLAANREEQLTLGVDFNFINDTTIETVKAYGSSDGWSRIQLRRFTDAKRIVEFIDGSVLQAGDLNVATLQALHIAQEGRDSAFDMLTVNSDGDYDAKGNRITNVGNPLLPSDVVNLETLGRYDFKAGEEADRAKEEADRAESAANSVLRPLRSLSLVIHYSRLETGEVRLPVIPVACRVLLQGKSELLDSSNSPTGIGDYTLSGSLLTFTSKFKPWDFIIVHINTEILYE